MQTDPVRVLLVEDDEADYILTRELLSEIEGTRFHLDWVSTYADAQQAIARNDHAVYLLDYQLGEHTGLELLREAVAGGCKGPLILLTGHGGREVDLEAMRAGAADYLVKDQINAALLERSIRYAIERKRAEKTLKIHARVLESMTEGVTLMDDQGIILFTNRAFDTMFGYASGELIGCPVDRIHDYPPEESLELFAQVRHDLSTHGSWIGALRARKIDGSAFPTEVCISTLEMCGGVYWVSVQQDITERMRLEERLRQAQKMEAVGRLAGGIAHDFNNLLTGILGYSQIRLHSLVGEDSQDASHPGLSGLREDFQEITRLAERAAALTRQLLAFSRKQILAFRVVDLNAIVADMDKMLRRVIGEDIELVTVLDPALHRVKVDISQMEQVILNLAVNARDAMPRGGTLTIRTHNVDRPVLPPPHALPWGRKSKEAAGYAHPAGGHVSTVPPQIFRERWSASYVQLAVSDTGCGMDEQTREHLFEPFFTTKSIAAGTGLGLATVYGIVQQTGGSIEVRSAVGKGTSFEIYLPCTEETESRSEDKPPTRDPTPRGRETVLLIEDEPSVRELVRMVLQRSGYNVLEAAQGSQALLIGEQFPGSIDLLIADIVMPKMSGCEVAERLAVLRPHMKVLYLSGHNHDTVRRHGVHESSMPFLPKPFSPATLARKVREVLDQPSAELTR
jgi:PAS domain S-box-containing protein